MKDSLRLPTSGEAFGSSVTPVVAAVMPLIKNLRSHLARGDFTDLHPRQSLTTRLTRANLRTDQRPADSAIVKTIRRRFPWVTGRPDRPFEGWVPSLKDRADVAPAK